MEPHSIRCAFLHGGLIEEVYITLPPGFQRGRENLLTNTIYKLHKAIYGLKQASRQWFSKFSKVLLERGFKQLASNHSFFLKIEGTSFLALLV